MSGFKQHTGLAIPLDIVNVDTDAIIPKQFLQKVTRSGFGKHLFHDWRFLDEAGQQPDPNFILNETIYQGASILLARDNFGCGSSREHAPWAIQDYGIKAIIAPSFADIFYNNCINNQILPIKLSADEVDALFLYLKKNKGVNLEINLEGLEIKAGDEVYSFKIDPFHQYCLLNGLDHIDLTLKHTAKIHEYEANIPNFMR